MYYLVWVANKYQIKEFYIGTYCIFRAHYIL